MNGSVARLRRMDAQELRFRAVSELRKWRSRVGLWIRPQTWRRGDLEQILARPARGDGGALTAARDAASARDWAAAHRVLARHFASRESAFPLNGSEVARLAAEINTRFPAASGDARERADRILAGRYDLLGYSGIHLGSPPDWHTDPLCGRRAPLTFWASVPYLDPACGDHKLVWELNRHQHWLLLGRAFALSSDRRYYREFVTQLEDWLAHNPPLRGTNWASMLELGFRSLSWLWAIAFFATASNEDPEEPWLVDLLVALDRQLTHVEHNLSRYFSPNTHLSGEALALYVAGRCLPELASSARRAEIGRDVLLHEIERQIGTDGGHVELSAHYQRYSTDFYLLAFAVARRSGDPAASRFQDAASRQARYLRAIADDCGRLPQLGDDDGGQLFPICRREPADCADSLAVAATLLGDPQLRVGPPPEEAYWMCGVAAQQPAGPVQHVPSRALSSSGYYVSRTREGDHLVFDAGRHGYLNGGHAHADALAVTLTVSGRPLLIDPGTATYTMDPEARDRFRSTSMHNTLVLDGRQQSRPRGPFHWDSAANARGFFWRSGERCDYVEGTHDGYAPFTHARVVLALHGIGWLVVDHVLGDGQVDAEASWHLAPGWHAVRGAERTVQLASAGVYSAVTSSAPLHIQDDVCSPVYGILERSITLHATASAALPLSFATFIAANREVADGLSIEPMPIDVPPGAAWHATAFHVEWRTGSARAVTAVERNGTPGSDDAAPGSPWGTRAFRTDGRTAALIECRGGPKEIVVVNGSMAKTGDELTTVEVETRLPLTHVARASVAPSVHRLAAHVSPELKAGRTAD